MGKIGIVFSKEYLQRLQSKGFIIGTLLAPLGMAVFFGIIIFSATLGLDDQSRKTIAVIDETRVLVEKMKVPKEYRIERTADDPAKLRMQVLDKKLDGYLILPQSLLEGEGQPAYFSANTGGISFQVTLQGAIREALREVRLAKAGASPEVMKVLNSEIDLKMTEVTAQGDKADSSTILMGIAYAMAFLIYIMMLIYGSLVMQSVIEEKTSRVLEVVVSSVRPYELMMGKVLGMGALGLTQLVIWLVLGMVMTSALGSLSMMFINPASFNLPAEASQQQVLGAAGLALPSFSPLFFMGSLVFFLGGYLLFSSLFAAIGSAVESPQDAQQLMMPITMLIIIPILFIHQVVLMPDGSLATWLSILPFGSPILMPARLAATAVPFWEVALAFVLLIAAFLGAIWVSARIYRIGILSYGKKPSFRDLLKWIRTA